MQGVYDQIGGLAVKQGKIRKPPDTMKLHGTSDKDLREPVGDMHGTKNMPNPGAFPVLPHALPQPTGERAAIGGQKIAPGPARHHGAIPAVEQIVEPHGARHLALDEAQEQEFVALADVAVELGPGGGEGVGIGHPEIVAVHGVPPDVALLGGGACGDGQPGPVGW